MTMAHSTCELCVSLSGQLLWQDELCRVIRVDDADYPGFCRVIWRQHRAEMSDLLPGEQRHLLSVVLALETAVRELYRPDKINLASLGNVVPHMHWHVIPRFQDDAHFPHPIWGERRRTGNTQRPQVSDEALRTALIAALAAEQGG